MKTVVVQHTCGECHYDGPAVEVEARLLCPNCGCPRDIKDALVIEGEEMFDYIQTQLIKEGIAVAKADIMKVFDLQAEFIYLKGGGPDDDKPPDEG